jgi:aspartyl-tRNA(Asn)/glutamyl-tRNA(Gln) amidotransferase subunit C
MSDSITPEMFNHLVGLAALELSPQEGEYLRQQLNNQLKVINELAAIPLDDSVPVAAHGVPYTLQNSQPPRADEWLPFEHPERIIAQAPRQSEDGYIIVPDIPHTNLE